MSGVVPNDELQKLLLEAAANGLTPDDLAATCEQFHVTASNLLNEMSITVAERYLEGASTYEFCNGVMNGIIGAIVDLGFTESMPQPAFSLYQAFDEGEWRRKGDPLDTDPGEKYVRPLVRQIMGAKKWGRSATA